VRTSPDSPQSTGWAARPRRRPSTASMPAVPVTVLTATRGFRDCGNLPCDKLQAAWMDPPGRLCCAGPRRPSCRARQRSLHLRRPARITRLRDPGGDRPRARSGCRAHRPPVDLPPDAVPRDPGLRTETASPGTTAMFRSHGLSGGIADGCGAHPTDRRRTTRTPRPLRRPRPAPSWPSSGRSVRCSARPGR
jgi:hypothetical protein